MTRLFHWCPHFRRYVSACTCHQSLPVSRFERLIVALALAKILGAR